jgi:DNA helicase-2/ATP-dependent DNA helicase PcrA
VLRVTLRGPSTPELLSGCDGEQAAAITVRAKRLLVVAPAGSGKTRVLTRRIAWRVLSGDAQAPHVLALTFTRKAAAEIRRRLAALGLPEPVTAGTFHAIALAELRRLAAGRGQAPPVVLGSKARLLHAVLTEGVPAGQVDVHRLSAEIEWAKARVVRPGGYEKAATLAGRRPGVPLGLVAELFEAYEGERRRRRLVDFEDLLTTCAAEMATDPLFAASAKWRFRHVFVDEYQDVNEAQLQLLRQWTDENADLCVVGDPDQSIYGWNGADPRAIERFSAQFEGATVLSLGTNYRSTSEILTVAGSLVGRSSPPVVGSVAPEGPVPTITAYETDVDEARGVAERAKAARGPRRSWSRIAVLARTNWQLEAFRRALEEVAVPYSMQGEPELLRRAHVAKLLTELYKARNGEALRRVASDLRLRLDGHEGTVGDEGEEPVEQGDAEGHDLAELVDLLEEYLATDTVASGAGLRTFLQTASRAGPAAGREDAVSLTTFHRAKGLEWSVVFVTGLEEGLVPIAHAETEDALAEERRLLYVACTRAEEELHCSWAKRRMLQERLTHRAPSPWLERLDTGRRRLERRLELGTSSARQALAEIRRSLGS